MTYSALKGRGTRERLVAGAQEVVYEQGVERTTIADVARAAGVPPGNVYYHFKTKHELVLATIDARAGQIAAMLASVEHHRTPRARLKALVRVFGEQRELAAHRGCPLGSLCQELDKSDGELQQVSRRLIEIPIAWAQEQFRLMGRRDARDLGVALMASYQGASLLANTLRDPDLMLREARRLERWIDTL